jgi:hypothetical protein
MFKTAGAERATASAKLSELPLADEGLVDGEVLTAIAGADCDIATGAVVVCAGSGAVIVRRSGRIHNSTAANASPATAHFKAKAAIDTNRIRKVGEVAGSSWDFSEDTLRVQSRWIDLCIMGNSLSL